MAHVEELIHDVNSKCSGLKEAVALLRKASPGERKELLTLMAEEAKELAKNIVDFDPEPTRNNEVGAKSGN